MSESKIQPLLLSVNLEEALKALGKRQPHEPMGNWEGDLKNSTQEIRKELQERLCRRLHLRSNGCIEWTGTNCRGYGRIYALGINCSTHRIAYQLYVGNIPEGFHVLHHCDNPACCNPSHLFTGTNLDNVKDMLAKKRHMNQIKVFCHIGHPLFGKNLNIRRNGERECVECRNAGKRRRRLRDKMKRMNQEAATAGEKVAELNAELKGGSK